MNGKKAKKVALVSVLTIAGVLLIPDFDVVCIILFAALALDMFNFVTNDDETKLEFECLNCNRKLSVTEISSKEFEVFCGKCKYTNVFICFATNKNEQLLEIKQR